MRKFCLCTLLVILLKWSFSVFCVVHHRTKLGPLKGTVMLSRDGRKFNAFMGVPYAKPPVGELRFRDPQPVQPWDGVLDATKYPPMCPQSDGNVGYRGQEDCLYLNLFVPQRSGVNVDKLPVWVFIYGGRRIAGHVSPYKHGPHYIMDKPVIFVTMTYRLGPLGFLSTEDSVIPGNYGLKDETMVLEWIRDHIEAFGGDPTNVTISGGSSGAIDVGLHLVSPRSKGLFHRAISQSGSPLITLMKPGSARGNAWKLAKIVGCSDKIMRSEELLRCLQKIPVEILIRRWSKVVFPTLYFAPVIEPKDAHQRFLIGNPYLEIRKSNSIPWLMGMNRNEGTCGIAGLFSDKVALNHFARNADALLPSRLQYHDSPDKGRITRLIREKYFQNKPLDQSFYGFAEVFGLSFFVVPGIETALHYNGPKYFYVYDHENKVSYVRNYYLRGVITKHKTGVTHGEELRSLQNYEMLLPPIIDGDDRIVSDQMISMWYNFVVCGNPNGENKEEIWKPVTTSDLEYLHIHNLTLVMKMRPFWDDYLFSKNLGHPFLNTVNQIK